jgi:hypothetical protein
MALIVEDGTAKSDAQVYCSVEYADAWHSARGITLWATLSLPEKEAALVRAAHYMQQAYRLRWVGQRKTVTQSMDWPRYNVPRADGPVAYGYGPAYYADNVVPIEVQQANAEMAFKAASGDLAADIAQIVKREKVDVIEVEYMDGSTPIVRYRAVDNLLGPLLKDQGGGSIQVSRS